MLCGVRNHELDPAHSFIDLLDGEEKEIIVEMTVNMILPKSILTILQKKTPGNLTNNKKLFNTRHKNDKEIRGPRTEM